MQMKSRYAAFVDDAGTRFRVDRAVYSDPAVYEAEIDAFYEGGWLYLCHESQLRAPGEYFSTLMGRQPVFLVRKRDGTVGGFINACSHRAATLVPYQSGKVGTFTCRFHGWVFGLDGRLMKVKNEESGDYAVDPRAEFSLTPIPRLANYRGFVFGSLRADVAPLDDYLGPTRPWIDLLVDQSPDGLEVLPGSSTYVVRGNWKMQAENGVDGYHVSTVHRVFAATVSNREAKLGLTGMARTESGRLTGNVASGGYDFGNGHMAIWAQHTDPTKRPIWQQKERLASTFPAAKVDWMINRGRNLYLFPNLLLMDNPSTQIRTIQPIAPDRSEVTVRCVAPVGESKAARSARLRKFEDFYLTTGMATSDDLAALESTHVGGYGRTARWNDFARGANAHVKHGAEDTDGAGIGSAPDAMTGNWDHEIMYRGFYRNWLRRLEGHA